MEKLDFEFGVKRVGVMDCDRDDDGRANYGSAAICWL